MRRILKMKFELGLFENPYFDETAHESVIRCEKHLDINLRAARAGMVLLTNNGILPLQEDYTRIAVIGPSSASQKIGGYSSKPYGYTIRSVYDELKVRYPHAEIRQCDGCAITHNDGETVHYVDGQPHLTTELDADIADMIEQAVEIARRAELEEKYKNDVADGVHAAVKGYVDDVIEPDSTRPRIIAALEMLSSKRDSRPAKKHGNLPV